MQNFGKYSQNLSGFGTQTLMELHNVLLAAAPLHGKRLTVDTVLEGSTRPPNMTKETTMRNAKNAMVLKVANKPSIKKKSKKGTVKERGTSSSLKVVKSVKGVKSKSR